MLSLPLVKKIEAHTVKDFLKRFLALSLLVLVLLSSCSIQRGLKTFFNFPVETTQTAKGAKIATANFGHVLCTKCSDLKIFGTDLSDASLLLKLSPAVILTALFTFLVGTFSFQNKGTRIFKIPLPFREIPKYLLFSKLLFYDLR